MAKSKKVQIPYRFRDESSVRKEQRGPVSRPETLDEREQGILRAMNDHSHCDNPAWPPAPQSLGARPLAIARHASNSPVHIIVAGDSAPLAGVTLGLVCGSTIELRVRVYRTHGDGISAEILGESVAGAVTVITDQDRAASSGRGSP